MLKNVLVQKWQPVITNYECPKQLLIVEKHQYTFSWGLHLYIKQNRTFLITNLSNLNTKSCLRNQTRLCIHLLVLLVPSHWHVFGVPCSEQSVLTISEISAKQNLKINKRGSPNKNVGGERKGAGGVRKKIQKLIGGEDYYMELESIV